MLKLTTILLLLAAAAFAQPQVWTGGGAFYNSDATVNAVGVTAKQLAAYNSLPTYLFVAVTVSNTEQVVSDILHRRPTTMLTTEETGLCQNLPGRNILVIPVYQCGTVGAAQANVTQQQVDWSSSFSLYTMAPIGVGKSGFTIIPVFKWNANGLGTKNWSGGLLFGWGR